MLREKVKRQAVALFVVLATTFGGWHAQHAGATDRDRPVTATPEVPAVRVDATEAAFAYGDLLEVVRYHAGFEPDARDAAELVAACSALLAADAPGDELRRLAAPIVSFCRDGSEVDAEDAAAAYVAYREKAFDLAD